MDPSSANKGFFQRQPVLRNQFYDDVSFQRITKFFLPASVTEQLTPELAQLGDKVLSPQIFNWVTDSEKNLPSLRGSGRDAFGKPKSELVLSEGWRKLQEFGFAAGMVAYNYDTDLGSLTRVVQFLRIHLWGGSNSNTLCPAAMHDGAARLLQRHLAYSKLDPKQRKVFQNAFDHLTSRDPARTWSSGQWMTERTGGSDVSRTETVATLSPYLNDDTTPRADLDEDIPLGPFSVDGFKWFSSATDSSMTILLAKTDPNKGVSAFFAPMKRYNPSVVSATGVKGGSEPNGVTISRLKNKLGTQSLPTAELELAGMRAWMIGDEGRGIQEISTMLSITRVHSTVSSMGYLGRGIAIAKAYALVRQVGAGGGRRVPLFRHPLHMRTLANLMGEYHALMLLVFYTAYILGMEEKSEKPAPPRAEDSTAALRRVTPPTNHIIPLLRILSSLQKAYVCATAIPLTHACMEALGGVGYLVNSESEHMNVARLFRDSCVLPIWEGTTDVLSSDTIRALKHPRTGNETVAALDWLVRSALGSSEAGDEGVEAIRTEWERLKQRVVRDSAEKLLPDARDIVFRIAEVLIAALYLVDAQTNPSAQVNAMRWRHAAKKSLSRPARKEAVGEAKSDLDLEIIYGVDFTSQLVSESRI